MLDDTTIQEVGEDVRMIIASVHGDHVEPETVGMRQAIFYAQRFRTLSTVGLTIRPEFDQYLEGFRAQRGKSSPVENPYADYYKLPRSTEFADEKDRFHAFGKGAQAGREVNQWTALLADRKPALLKVVRRTPEFA